MHFDRCDGSNTMSHTRAAHIHEQTPAYLSYRRVHVRHAAAYTCTHCYGTCKAVERRTAQRPSEHQDLSAQTQTQSQTYSQGVHTIARRASSMNQVRRASYASNPCPMLNMACKRIPSQTYQPSILVCSYVGSTSPLHPLKLGVAAGPVGWHEILIGYGNRRASAETTTPHPDSTWAG